MEDILSKYNYDPMNLDGAHIDEVFEGIVRDLFTDKLQVAQLAYIGADLESNPAAHLSKYANQIYTLADLGFFIQTDQQEEVRKLLVELKQIFETLPESQTSVN